MSGRMNRDQLTLVARLHAEKLSRSEESQASGATQESLAKAHELIVRLVLERDSERRMRLDAEAKVQSAKHGREAAMRALQKAVQALRKLKTQAAERESEAETERRARESAEAQGNAEQHAHEDTAREVRVIRSAAEAQGRAFARLEVRCKAMATQLNELEGALAQAEYVAYLQSLEQTELKAGLETKRTSRRRGGRARG
jgi:membrane protein involved in colicin uptake